MTNSYRISCVFSEGHTLARRRVIPSKPRRSEGITGEGNELQAAQRGDISQWYRRPPLIRLFALPIRSRRPSVTNAPSSDETLIAFGLASVMIFQTCSQFLEGEVVSLLEVGIGFDHTDLLPGLILKTCHVPNPSQCSLSRVMGAAAQDSLSVRMFLPEIRPVTRAIVPIAWNDPSALSWRHPTIARRVFSATQNCWVPPCPSTCRPYGAVATGSMGCIPAFLVEKRAHRNVLESGQDGLPFATALDLEAVVRHAVVEGARIEDGSVPDSVTGIVAAAAES
ncbi:hypothetical protein R3P38DRAFT_3221851 [Favolaschia claudopus]|uniref:Uncharacterized protein n=1 Tax=Favolaschia claudopus TaxID=2862362 RepID=A0AAW0A0Y0_9AGAR